MKHSILYTAAFIALSLVSCTRVKTYDEPEIKDYGITVVNASMDSVRLDGLASYKWKTTDTIGIYGSEKGENVPYVPFDSSAFCGDLVKGTLTLYWPYLQDGSAAVEDFRLPLKPNIPYCGSLEELLWSNMTFVCRGEPSDFHFTLHTGILKMDFAVERANIASLVLKVRDKYGVVSPIAGNLALDGQEPLFTSPATALKIEDIGGRAASEERPLTFYAALPEGDYPTFDIIAGSVSGASVTYHSKEGISVRGKCLTSCTLKIVNPWWGAGSWSSESGEYIKEGE